MNIGDLKRFLVIAKYNNLQQAAYELNVTPGALSKSVKRLEAMLCTSLFNRTGRSLSLNEHGEKLRLYAINLVHEGEQILSEFGGAISTTQVRISGPSLLLQHFLKSLTLFFPREQYTLHINTVWEGEALDNVATGQSHLALVTKQATGGSAFQGVDAIDIGTTQFKVVASRNHKLFCDFPSGRLTNAELIEYPFACPSVSPFCGAQRGVGSDGWRDDKVPRTIGFRCNDFSVLMSLVNEGLALAYVPHFIADREGLQIIDVVDCGYNCEEHVQLLYKPSFAVGWLNRFVGNYL